MTEPLLEEYVITALGAIKGTLYSNREELMAHYGIIEHEKKADNSSVTHLDKHLEIELKKSIANIDTSIGFYGEEFGKEGNEDRFWTIDPIDGTESFIRGLPFCSSMLCLIVDGRLVASVIYNFPQDEMFEAINGKGATCNDKKLQVSDRQMGHASIEFEIVPSSQQNRDLFFDLPRLINVKFTAAGFGFCQVAKGAIEARVQYDAYGKVWDYAPGALLVKEAGGVVANINSNSYDYKNLNFIASNRHVYDELQHFFVSKKLQ